MDFWACYPENTFPAVEASISRSNFIAFDVRHSCDLVTVIHDSTLNRTSSVNSERYQSRQITDYSLT